jgi:Lrp/AsnC family leucine-responsive transcriptional regulator
LLDDIGWHILKELNENARISFSELGRRVGLSVPAVTERVRRMEDTGIIRGYRAELNMSKIGLPIIAFMRLSMVGDVYLRLTALLKEIPEIAECHRVTGGDSFILKVHVSSVEHLEELIDKFTPIATTVTTIVLSTLVDRAVVEKK